MEWWHWAIILIVLLFVVFRVFAWFGARVQTGRAIEAFVVGAKAPAVAQDLAWWHIDGKRYMVAAGYIMGKKYSSEDSEAKYTNIDELLLIAQDVCTVEAVTKVGQQLETTQRQ